MIKYNFPLDLPPKVFDNQIARFTVLDAACEQIGKVVREEVRGDLRKKLVSPEQSTGHAERSFDYEVKRRVYQWTVGIGNVKYIKKVCPYFWVIDEGTSANVGMVVPGYFVDASKQTQPFTQERFRQDWFIYTGRKVRIEKQVWAKGRKPRGYFMIVSKKIPRKNFIKVGDFQAYPKVEWILKNVLHYIIHGV